MKNNLFDLSGQVAFCCGGSSGLGLQFAKAMANAGADIALVARRTDRLDENAKEIEAEYGVKVYPHYMDLQDSKSITDCVSDVVAHFGKIDILVNAAGIPGGGDPATLTDEYWLNVINTDLNGQFFTCREVVRQSMKPNQYGRIIMVSSIHGVCGRKGVDTAPYAAAKGGIVNLTRSLGNSWARDGITVNCICAGLLPDGNDRGLHRRALLPSGAPRVLPHGAPRQDRRNGRPVHLLCLPGLQLHHRPDRVCGRRLERHLISA